MRRDGSCQVPVRGAIYVLDLSRSAENVRPSPWRADSQSRLRPWLTQVRFTDDAASSSTRLLPSFEPKYQTHSTCSCAARFFRQLLPVACHDVYDARGHIRGLNHPTQVERGSGMRWTAITQRRPIADDGREQREDESEERRPSGQATPTTPMGSGTASDGPARAVVNQPVVLVRPAAILNRR